MPNSLFDPAFQKPAPADFPVHELLRYRWSPRAFSGDELGATELHLLFEAARWAPSAFNEQPWTFLVAMRQHAVDFDRLLSCLNPSNQVWARHASGLFIAVVRRDLAAKPQPNRTGQYDLGQAVAHFTFQATALGVAVHQMAGMDLELTRSTCEIPAGYDPVTAVAFGRPGEAHALPDAVRQREASPRVRKPLREIVLGARWSSQLMSEGTLRSSPP